MEKLQAFKAHFFASTKFVHLNWAKGSNGSIYIFLIKFDLIEVTFFCKNGDYFVTQTPKTAFLRHKWNNIEIYYAKGGLIYNKILI